MPVTATFRRKLRLYSKSKERFLSRTFVPLRVIFTKSALCVVVLYFSFFSPAFSQLKFIQNAGQWPAKALYKASLANGDLWLTDSGLLFSLWDADAAQKMHDRALNTFTLKRHAFYLHFKGGSMSGISTTGEQSGEYYNYFLGNDPVRWKTGLYGFGELLVSNLYEGVDLHIYSVNGNLKYNLICRIPENLEKVKLQYIGVDGLQVQDNKIEVHTSIQDFTDAMPLVLGEANGTKEPIQAVYELDGNEISFHLQGNVQRRYSSILVDPILVFSTYSGSTADNFGCTGTYDDQGNGFAGGTVFSVGFPATLGAFQTTFAGGTPENIGYGDGRDAGILKFSPDGKTLLFCTYLGGSDNEQPHSMMADANGDLYIMGSTRSSNFPMPNGAYDNSSNGDYDFFVAHLSKDGKKLLGATYMGGNGLDAVGANRESQSIDNFPLLYNYADEFRGEVITDGKNVYVSGVTYSINFPRSNNSGWFGGKEDAVLFSLSADLSNLNWSEIVGGQGYDAFYGVAMGKSNDIYASGGTSSPNLNSLFSQWGNGYIGGIADGMAVRFNKQTGAMQQAKYIGTSQYEQAYFAQTDNTGNPYFYGQTEGTFPIFNSPFNQPGTGQFILRMDTTLQNITLSTSFGSGANKPNISPSAFLIDQCERIFVSGWGGKTNSYLYDFFTFEQKKHRNLGSTFGMPISSDAVQKNTDGSDFYVAVFAKNMYALLYGTYFGGISSLNRDAQEHVDGGTSRFDRKGIIYQAVCAGCEQNGLFPTTPGAYSTTNKSPNCNNALFKIDFENLNRKPFMKDTFIEVVATDKIDVVSIASDPDPADNLKVKIFLVNKAGMTAPDTPVFSFFSKDINIVAMHLLWNTGCTSWSKDTIVYRLMLYDNGCPHADTTWATLKILIKEPPRVIPPDAICVSFDRVSGKLKISWPQTSQPNRFFNYFVLQRKDPAGKVIALDTIRDTMAGSFIDVNVTDPNLNDYCYWLDGYNICGTKVAAVIPFCTVQELNSPISSVHIKYATVELDKRVKVFWETSKEPDFKEYELYRFPRGGSVGKIPIAHLNDTSYTDSSFNVDAESYCYSIVVADKCSHASQQSNMGCNVVIKGTATGKPQYFFDLSWQDYVGWAQGVQDWTLERQYAYNNWTVISNTGTQRSYRDDQLDFDWGGYWYRTTAMEALKGQSRQPYYSQSNWIYLYQPPEVYVPSAFTVNGDNLNEVWGTVPVFVKNYNMKVYNRWGEKIWESTAKKLQWDANVDGIKAADGVYAWYVIFDGWDNKTYRMEGTVTVIH